MLLPHQLKQTINSLDEALLEIQRYENRLNELNKAISKLKESYDEESRFPTSLHYELEGMEYAYRILTRE
jgi:cell shape-determining protein MreC